MKTQLSATTKPCDNCPETKINPPIDLVEPPLDYQWVAIDSSDQEILQAPYTNEEKQLADIDTKNLKKFGLRDWENRDMFGIDVERRAFVIWGKYFYLDLPEGQYEVVNIRRNCFNSDGTFERTYILGLKGQEERYLYIYPDKHIEFCWRLK